MALSADRILTWQPGETIDIGVEGLATSIYKGALVGMSASGHAQPQTLTQTETFIGISRSAEVDNSSGSDGDLDVTVQIKGSVWLPNSTGNAITLAMRGELAYAEDDQYVRKFVTTGVNVPVGRILDVDSTKGVLVALNEAAGAVSSDDFEVLDDLIVGGDADVAGDVSCDNLSVTTDASVGGDATVTGDIGAGTATITGAASAASASITGLMAAGHVSGAYGEVTTGAAPTQAQMVAAFGAGSDGEIAVFEDDTGAGKQPYLCVFTTDGGGWWQLALTAVGGA